MLDQKLKTITICGSIGQHKGLLKDEECRMLFDYLYENTKKQNYLNKNLPWLYGNNLFIESIKDKTIKQLSIFANAKTAEYLSNFYGVKLYPHFSDLVLWDAGCYMNRHVDNLGENLFMRHVSAVLYLNEDFVGGSTFVSVNGSDNEDFVINPSTGTMLSFLSDNKNAHGVTEITDGKRGTLAMWFTKDENFKNPLLEQLG
jgi:Rps23 Pro-64 3,4-dihydroxylase Tpa1-like proline 4-hydroxylase